MVILLFAGCLTAMACTVDGKAVAGSSDLSSRSVTADAFPAGASRVPGPAVTGALADLTGHPLNGGVTPADCAPPAVTSDGAVVYVGPDPTTSTATYSTAVVHARGSLGQVTDQARRCPRYVTGSSLAASTLVTTDVLDKPDAPVASAGVRRGLATGGGTGSSAVNTQITTLFAQKDNIRVIVEYRHQGDAPMSTQAAQRLHVLFGKAVAAAFD